MENTPESVRQNPEPVDEKRRQLLFAGSGGLLLALSGCTTSPKHSIEEALKPYIQFNDRFKNPESLRGSQVFAKDIFRETLLEMNDKKLLEYAPELAVFAAMESGWRFDPDPYVSEKPSEKEKNIFGKDFWNRKARKFAKDMGWTEAKANEVVSNFTLGTVDGFSTMGLWQVNYEKYIVPELEKNYEKYRKKIPQVFYTNGKVNRAVLSSMMANMPKRDGRTGKMLLKGDNKEEAKAITEIILETFYKPLIEEIESTYHKNDHKSLLAEHHERLSSYKTVVQKILKNFLEETDEKAAEKFSVDGYIGKQSYSAMKKMMTKKFGITEKSAQKKYIQEFMNANSYKELSETLLYKEIMKWGGEKMGTGEIPEEGSLRAWINFALAMQKAEVTNEYLPNIRNRILAAVQI